VKVLLRHNALINNGTVAPLPMQVTVPSIFKRTLNFILYVLAVSISSFDAI
jgi:hypothetical protein